MALNEGEVTFNSSNLNSYSFEELQEAYDKLAFEFKASFSKNKMIISKLKIGNDLLSKINFEIEARLKEFELKVFYLQNLLQKMEKDHQIALYDLKKEKDLISKEL